MSEAMSDARKAPRYERASMSAAPARQARRATTPLAPQPVPLVLPWPHAHRPVMEQGVGFSHTPTTGALALVEEPAVGIFPVPTTANHTVLIVEDDYRLAAAVRSALELEGEPDWQVVVASDGQRALDLATTHAPRVVLLDVGLPGVDGVEVYRRLRAREQTRDTRVLFVTAATSFDLHQRGIRDGVLLRKPFDLAELVGLVRALLSD